MAENFSQVTERVEKQGDGSLFSQFMERHPDLNFAAAPLTSSTAMLNLDSTANPAESRSYQLPKIDLVDEQSGTNRRLSVQDRQENNGNSAHDAPARGRGTPRELPAYGSRFEKPNFNPEKTALSNTEKPVPRNSEDWRKQHDALVHKAETSNTSIAFFGDSITKGMESGNALKKFFGNSADNFGIVGDSTQHLLWRLQHGEANFKQNPQESVLLIGANNIGAASTKDIVKGILANVNEMQKQMPDTKLLVLGVLPQGKNANDPRREKIKEINEELKRQLTGRSNLTYYDVGPNMLEKDGSMSSKIWWGDGLHPKDYAPMFSAIKPLLEKMKSGK